MNVYYRMKEKYFGRGLGMQALKFNLFGLACGAAGFILLILNVVLGAGVFNIVLNAALLAFVAAAVMQANATREYELFSLIIVTALFLVFFPAFFFTTGGYGGVIPGFYIFAPVMTITVLNGKKRICFVAAEILIYAGCFAAAHYYPYFMISFAAVKNTERDVIIGCAAASAALSVMVIGLVKFYEREQTELEENKWEYRRESQMKTEFIRYASHELKTPTAVIMNYARDTERELDNPDFTAKDILFSQSRIVSECDHIKRILKQLLDITAIESGRMKIVKKPLSLKELARNAAESFAHEFERGGNELRLELPDTLKNIYADRDIIKQVIMNLLSNAAKHTKNGTVTIRLTESDDFQSLGVTDTGEGIRPDVLKQVFKNYIECGNSGESSGLGLYICKKYIDAHGGEIRIESEAGKGTNVWFELPA